MRRLLVVVLALLAPLSACTAGSTPTTPPPSADPLDYSHLTELDARLVASQLPESALPAEVRTPLINIDDIVGGHLLQACNASLPTDARLITERAVAWTNSGHLPLIEQWGGAYDRPVAAEALASVPGMLTCVSYTMRDAKITILPAFTVSAVPGAYGFCEEFFVQRRKYTSYRCTVLLAIADIACTVRVGDETLDAAKAVVQQLAPALRDRCR